MDFFLKCFIQVIFIAVNRHVQFGNPTSSGKVITAPALLWLPFRNEIFQSYLNCLFSRSKGTVSMQNFKHLCNSIIELLIVFEYPAQYIHAIIWEVRCIQGGGESLTLPDCFFFLLCVGEEIGSA